jgi:hypothetical protein
MSDLISIEISEINEALKLHILRVGCTKDQLAKQVSVELLTRLLTSTKVELVDGLYYCKTLPKKHSGAYIYCENSARARREKKPKVDYLYKPFLKGDNYRKPIKDSAVEKKVST